MAIRLHSLLELERQPGRLAAMEGLRGLAVLLVFLQHYAVQASLVIDLSGAERWSVAWMRNFGSIGVELFFVLSGFLIYVTLLRRRPGFGVFMRRRLQRIYPAFLPVFAVITAAHLVFGTGEIPADPWQAGVVVLANLLLLPGVLEMNRLVDVAWSLSWEMAFYLALGVAVPSLALHRRSRRLRVALILASAAATGAAAWAAPGGIGPFAVPLPVLSLLAGMLLLEARDAGAGRVSGPAGFAATAAALSVAHGFEPSALPRALLETLALALLCAAALSGPHGLSRLFSLVPLRWLGNMSYSFYLVHGTVVVAGFRALAWLLGPGWPSGTFWLLLLPAFAAAWAGSLVLYAAIERPLSLAPRGVAPVVTPIAAS